MSVGAFRDPALHGERESMYIAAVPRSLLRAFTALETSSGRLSLRMCGETPRITLGSYSTITMSSPSR